MSPWVNPNSLRNKHTMRNMRRRIMNGLTVRRLDWKHDSADAWKSAVLSCFADSGDGPDEVSVFASGPERWLCDLVWSIGNPLAKSFFYFSLALECNLAWDASDMDQWLGLVMPSFNRVLGTSAWQQIFVTAVRFPACNARETLTLLAEHAKGYNLQTERLVAVLSAPSSGTRGCRLDAALEEQYPYEPIFLDAVEC